MSSNKTAQFFYSFGFSRTSRPVWISTEAVLDSLWENQKTLVSEWRMYKSRWDTAIFPTVNDISIYYSSRNTISCFIKLDLLRPGPIIYWVTASSFELKRRSEWIVVFWNDSILTYLVQNILMMDSIKNNRCQFQLSEVIWASFSIRQFLNFSTGRLF